MHKVVYNLNLVASEILTGLPVIRAFSREKYEEDRFDKANKDLTSTMLFTNRTMTFMMPLMMMIMNLITVLIIWVGAGQISDGSLQVGDMMAFITYTMQIVMSFLMLTMISIMLPRAAVSADRINEVITAKKSIEDKPGAGTFDKSTLRGNVTFDHVSFRYPDADEDVLTDIDFTANAGETTAIIGSTGSCKSVWYTGTCRLCCDNESRKCIFTYICIHWKCSVTLCFPESWCKENWAYQKRISCCTRVRYMFCSPCFHSH